MHSVRTDMFVLDVHPGLLALVIVLALLGLVYLYYDHV